MEQIVKKFQKMGTAALIAKVEKLKGEEREVVIDLLEKRNQDVSQWKTGAVPPVGTVVFEDDEPLTKEQEKQLSNAEKMQKTLDKADKALEKSTKVKAEKAPKTPKVKKEKVIKEKKEKPEGPTQSRKIKDLAAEGMPRADIAKTLGIKYQIVFNVLKKDGYVSKP